jgi:hypothetical protein
MTNLVHAPELCLRKIRTTLHTDWHDGPLEGVLGLSDPEEEVGYKEVGPWRYNPEGLDLRMMKTWPLPLGTIARIELERSALSSGHSAVVHNPRDEQLARITSLLRVPPRSELFIALSSGDGF